MNDLKKLKQKIENKKIDQHQKLINRLDEYNIKNVYDISDIIEEDIINACYSMPAIGQYNDDTRVRGLGIIMEEIFWNVLDKTKFKKHADWQYDFEFYPNGFDDDYIPIEFKMTTQKTISPTVKELKYYLDNELYPTYIIAKFHEDMNKLEIINIINFENMIKDIQYHESDYSKTIYWYIDELSRYFNK